MNLSKTIRPLGQKCYGSVCHLPGSRLGPGDHKLNPGQARILTEKARDKHDVIVVQEKLDGSNVAVARIDGQIVALGRAGYPAVSSPYEQHRIFAAWVASNLERFAFLSDGQWVSGEWLAQAHGTRYNLTHAPLVPFDLFDGGRRVSYEQFTQSLAPSGLPLPKLLHRGSPFSIEQALAALGSHGHHGSLDPVEGAVWRVERKGIVDFLGKYVRPGKVDGAYLPEIAGTSPLWNWRP